MKFRTLLGLIAAIVVMPTYAQVAATQNPAAQSATDGTSTTTTATQPTGTPTVTDSTASSDAARSALAKQSTDVDQTSQILKQTLTAVDKDYTLIKRGTYQLTYDANYSYIGQEKINTDLSSGTATLFSIENDNSHTLTNTFSLDYGILNNLTGNFTLPLVSRYSETATVNGTSNTWGDVSFGGRYQPFEAQRDSSSITLTGKVSLPTGTSPFKVIAGSGLATGAGVTAFTGGVNINKIVDPVALFGSLNVTYNLPVKNLSQALDTSVLTEVKPGTSVGFGAGFAYALSYAITTSFSFQESISAASKLTFINGITDNTASQVAAILSIGMGYRVSPKTTVNTSVGIGLTANTPNLTIDVTLPVSF